MFPVETYSLALTQGKVADNYLSNSAAELYPNKHVFG